MLDWIVDRDERRRATRERKKGEPANALGARDGSLAPESFAIVLYNTTCS